MGPVATGSVPLPQMETLEYQRQRIVSLLIRRPESNGLQPCVHCQQAVKRPATAANGQGIPLPWPPGGAGVDCNRIQIMAIIIT